MEERCLAPGPDAGRHGEDQPGAEPAAAVGAVGADRADLRPARWVQPLAGHRDEGTAAPDTNGNSRDIAGPGDSFMI